MLQKPSDALLGASLEKHQAQADGDRDDKDRPVGAPR
jgi:hypothetical protein